MAERTPETPTLQDDLRRLEEIVRRLEVEDADLDAALALFEEGVVRLRAALELLAEAEATVKRVVEQADGTVGLVDLED